MNEYDWIFKFIYVGIVLSVIFLFMFGLIIGIWIF